MTSIRGSTLHQDQPTFLIISCSFLLRMTNVSDRRTENQNTHFVFSHFFPENRVLYQITFVQTDKPQITIWSMRIACWIPKATNTHSEYVICIAFALQPRLHERASVLRHSPFPVLSWYVKETPRTVVHIK